MDTARADALAARGRLATQGWIARKAESFRHLPPPAAALWTGDEAEPATLDEAAALADGWSLQSLAGGSDVEVRWFDCADPGQRAEVFAGLPAPADDEAAPFAWAHRALVRQALRLRIAPSAQPAQLLLQRHAAFSVEAPLLLIELQPGARCVLLETHAAAAAAVTQNLQIHLRLAEGAQLHHLRDVQPGAADRVAHHLHVRIERDAAYAQALLAGGSGYHLQRNVIELRGDGAQARLAGVLLAGGLALEQQVLARHAAPRTSSGAEILALARGGAHLVANAHTHIAPGCDDAQTRQRLVGIPTGGGQPRIVLRPHLEIHHDQVQAAHGATWGRLPEEALFHARQRGLAEPAAKALIVEGLARATLARAVADETVPEALRLEAGLQAAVARHLGTV